MRIERLSGLFQLRQDRPGNFRIVKPAVGRKRDAILLKIFNPVKSEDMLKDKEEAHKALTVIMQWHRDILMLKLGLPEDYLINRDRLEELRQAARVNSYSSLISVIDTAGMTFEYLKRNLNTRLLSDNIQISLKNG